VPGAAGPGHNANKHCPVITDNRRLHPALPGKFASGQLVLFQSRDHLCEPHSALPPYVLNIQYLPGPRELWKSGHQLVTHSGYIYPEALRFFPCCEIPWVHVHSLTFTMYPSDSPSARANCCNAYVAADFPCWQAKRHHTSVPGRQILITTWSYRRQTEALVP